MAENKKSFLLYTDMIHTIEKMPDDKAGALLKHIFRYVNDLNPVTDDMVVDLVFEPIKHQMKRDLIAWEKSKEKKSQSGKKGMEARWGKKGSEASKNDNETITSDNTVIDAITEITVTDTVNVTVNDTVTDKNRAKALVAEKSAPGPTKQEYQKIVDEFSGKELKTVVVVMKEFLARKPVFVEPYRDYWNIAVEKTSIPKVKSISDTRVKKVKTRLAEIDFDFVEIIKKINASVKLKTESPWFSFDWVFENQTNYIKILEGNYDN